MPVRMSRNVVVNNNFGLEWRAPSGRHLCPLGKSRRALGNMELTRSFVLILTA